MNNYDIIRFGLICALNAEIDGMKALNTERESNGHALGYDESDFVCKAEEIRTLCSTHDEQL